MDTNRNYISIKGTVELIEEELTIERVNGPLLRKRVITLKTPDKQVFFFEIRNNKLELLQKNSVKVGNTVKITFTGQGSVKNQKRYNNLIISYIENI